ncbi:glycine cleavage system H-protein subunit [Elasticomyces elasticus]|nr:glycine cleavage system H-protein subunit [Elasticomyces elasticus]KAK3667605.1 glycine cleavage system H-protein subunit [Elasticomyces elasticus]KAK4928439.1 glycine cleavage system H-protein subunit [Elasticomyces elasticus]KAK5767240.1 glycine cleavage system H-protein subunit [Elasticomyces elasticus]
MAAVIAGSGAAVAKLLQRPAQGLARCSRQQYLRLRAQHIQPAAARSFTAGRRGPEKKYTEDHEWIDISSPDSASIGISTYAAKALGDVVYVELPVVDTEVKKGDAIGAVESVKSASDIMTPVGGTILEVNSVLEDKPGTINKSPEGDGWLAKIKVSDAAELEGLMDAEAYRAFTEEVDTK